MWTQKKRPVWIYGNFSFLHCFFNYFYLFILFIICCKALWFTERMLDINKVRFPFIGIKFVRQLAASEWLMFQPAAMVYLFGRREQERMKDRKQLAWANTTVCVNQAEHSVFWNQPWSESWREKKESCVQTKSSAKSLLFRRNNRRSRLRLRGGRAGLWHHCFRKIQFSALTRSRTGRRFQVLSLENAKWRN